MEYNVWSFTNNKVYQNVGHFQYIFHMLICMPSLIWPILDFNFPWLARAYALTHMYPYCPPLVLTLVGTWVALPSLVHSSTPYSFVTNLVETIKEKLKFTIFVIIYIFLSVSFCFIFLSIYMGVYWQNAQIEIIYW